MWSLICVGCKQVRSCGLGFHILRQVTIMFWKLLGPCFVPGSSTTQTDFFPNAEERWLADHPQLFGDTGEKGGVKSGLFSCFFRSFRIIPACRTLWPRGMGEAVQTWHLSPARLLPKQSCLWCCWCLWGMCGGPDGPALGRKSWAFNWWNAGQRKTPLDSCDNLVIVHFQSPSAWQSYVVLRCSKVILLLKFVAAAS